MHRMWFICFFLFLVCAGCVHKPKLKYHGYEDRSYYDRLLFIVPISDKSIDFSNLPDQEKKEYLSCRSTAIFLDSLNTIFAEDAWRDCGRINVLLPDQYRLPVDSILLRLQDPMVRKVISDPLPGISGSLSLPADTFLVQCAGNASIVLLLDSLSVIRSEKAYEATAAFLLYDYRHAKVITSASITFPLSNKKLCWKDILKETRKQVFKNTPFYAIHPDKTRYAFIGEYRARILGIDLDYKEDILTNDNIHLVNCTAERKKIKEAVAPFLTTIVRRHSEIVSSILKAERSLTDQSGSLFSSKDYSPYLADYNGSVTLVGTSVDSGVNITGMFHTTFKKKVVSEIFASALDSEFHDTLSTQQFLIPVVFTLQPADWRLTGPKK